MDDGWTTIRYLQAQGKSIHAIAKEMGVTRKVVRRALRAEDRPCYERAKRTNTKLEPYLAQIRELHFTKHLIDSRILREIQAWATAVERRRCTTHLRGLR